MGSHETTDSVTFSHLRPLHYTKKCITSICSAILQTHVSFSFFHVTSGPDVWCQLPHSVHGEFLHYSRSRSSQVEKQESETKEHVMDKNKHGNKMLSLQKKPHSDTASIHILEYNKKRTSNLTYKYDKW